MRGFAAGSGARVHNRGAFVRRGQAPDTLRRLVLSQYPAAFATLASAAAT
jgi:hypothetical protein